MTDQKAYSGSDALDMYHDPTKLITSGEDALNILKSGNKRYLLQKKRTYDNKADRQALVNGQQPVAVVLCCADSRVPPELIFDQKLGDIFTIRNAGNIVDQTVLGSIEYAVGHLKTPLIVVMGHSKCGAVTAACSSHDEEVPENTKELVATIQKNINLQATLEENVKSNTAAQTEAVKNNATVQKCGTLVVQAYYDITSGEVTWM